MKVKQAYTTWSSTYDDDRNLTRDLDAEVTQQTLGNLRCKSILEIGCGTGKNTALLTRIGEQVLALDFSEAMIEKARQKLSARNVTFLVADAGRPWPCRDQSVDFISCNLVLEHISDLAFIFAEAARVLITGGQLFISELHPFRQYLGTKARFDRDQTTNTIEAFVHNVTDFTDAAKQNKLLLESIKEWRHEEDEGKPPRLISFLFMKPGSTG